MKNNKEVWVVTEEINDYNQHGEYLQAVYFNKPTAKQIAKDLNMNPESITISEEDLDYQQIFKSDGFYYLYLTKITKNGKVD